MKKGYIGLFSLDKWWNEELNNDDRIWLLNNYERELYNPLEKYDKESGRYLLLEIESLNLNDTKNYFIYGVLCCALGSNSSKAINYNLALKIIDIQEHTNIDDAFSVHLSYGAMADWYYKQREKPIFLNRAIEFYKKQISISKEAMEWYLEDNKRLEKLLKRKIESVMPQNKGYNQLIMIYEKEKQYTKIITICKKAMLEGWARDKYSESWNDVIERLNKKLSS